MSFVKNVLLKNTAEITLISWPCYSEYNATVSRYQIQKKSIDNSIEIYSRKNKFKEMIPFIRLY